MTHGRRLGALGDCSSLCAFEVVITDYGPDLNAINPRPSCGFPCSWPTAPDDFSSAYAATPVASHARRSGCEEAHHPEHVRLGAVGLPNADGGWEVGHL